MSSIYLLLCLASHLILTVVKRGSFPFVLIDLSGIKDSLAVHLMRTLPQSGGLV